MKCVYCGQEMQLRQEHCPRCGKKAVVDIDNLTQSVHEDAAERRGKNIEDYMKWAILALVLVGAVLYGFNDMYDKPLVFDGSAAIAMPSVDIDPPRPQGLQKKFTEPRSQPTVVLYGPKVFGYRKSPIREKLREANRGDIPIEGGKSVATAVKDGLAFLSKSQMADGSWGSKVMPAEWDQWNTRETQWGATGITGLALLAFFGDGETWLPDEQEPPKLGEHAESIRTGLSFLTHSQDEATGRFGPGEGQAVHFMYNHSIATLAVTEAAGLSGDMILRSVAQKGIDYLVKTQTPNGGWNYFGTTVGNDDTSVSSWAVQALLAAKGIGLTVPEETLTKAHEMYKKASLGGPDYRVVYDLSKMDDKLERPALQGAALMLRQLLGEPRTEPQLRQIAARLQTAQPMVHKSWGDNWVYRSAKNDDGVRAKYDPYTMYYVTYGMFFIGGRDWELWHEGMKDTHLGMKETLLTMQNNDGSWKCNDPFSFSAGTNYSTALSILTLQVYYRIH